MAEKTNVQTLQAFFPPETSYEISGINGRKIMKRQQSSFVFLYLTVTSILATYLTLWSYSNVFAGQLPKSSNDFVWLSERWWGTPIEKFPEVANLHYGEYIQEDDPSKLTTNKVIGIDAKKVKGKWSPEDLPPFSFTFSPEKGLIEISGFLSGSIDNVLHVMEKRYGKYDKVLSALGFKTYVWKFDKTVLEVSSNGEKAFIYKMYPRQN